MLRNVAAVVGDSAAAFELGVISEVFGLDRTASGLPGYDFAVCAVRPGLVPTTSGYAIAVEHGLPRATHWRHPPALADRYPAVRVDAAVLYVEDGPVITSAGAAAAIDACLHLVREEHGAAVANALARRMVVSPHRAGGQAQFVEAPVPAALGGDHLGDALEWARHHLDQPLTVAALAERAVVSPRTFARRFTAATGTTPRRWLLEQRLGLAEHLLEDTDLSIDQVARRAGLGSADTLRHHFTVRRWVSPTAYRRAFHTPARLDGGSRP